MSVFPCDTMMTPPVAPTSPWSQRSHCVSVRSSTGVSASPVPGRESARVAAGGLKNGDSQSCVCPTGLLSREGQHPSVCPGTQEASWSRAAPSPHEPASEQLRTVLEPSLLGPQDAPGAVLGVQLTAHNGLTSSLARARGSADGRGCGCCGQDGREVGSGQAAPSSPLPATA